MIHYLWWIPTLVLLMVFTAWLSYKNNNEISPKYLWIMWGTSFLSPWVLISRVSPNLTFDSVLYDFVMTVSFIFPLIFFQEQIQRFSIWNWTGLFLCIIGLLLFRIKQ